MKYQIVSVLLSVMIMAGTMPAIAQESIENGSTIIGGADGPTSIFLAGKLGGEDAEPEYDDWEESDEDDWEEIDLEDDDLWEYGDEDAFMPVDYTPYDDILKKYVQAETEKWDMEKLTDEKMSTLVYYCYKDRDDEVIGFLPYDLDFDGTDELLIGTLTGDEYNDKMIMDAYTLKDGEAVKIFESSERDRYYLMYDEAGSRMIANEASSSAMKSGWHYYIFNGEKLEVMQGILYDEEASPDAPWFQTYDDDWDVSNDEAVDEAYAQEIIEAYEKQCQGTGYLYASQGFFIPDGECDIPDEWADYGSFEELIADLPEGYGYAYADLENNGNQYLILTDRVYKNDEGKDVSTSAMVYMMGSQGTMNMGNCFSYDEAYPIRIKDGVLYSGSEYDMEASAISKETGYIMCLYTISQYTDENGATHYSGFIRSDNSFEADTKDVEDGSEEEFQNALKQYYEMPVLEFTAA